MFLDIAKCPLGPRWPPVRPTALNPCLPLVQGVLGQGQPVREWEYLITLLLGQSGAILMTDQLGSFLGICPQKATLQVDRNSFTKMYHNIIYDHESFKKDEDLVKSRTEYRTWNTRQWWKWLCSSIVNNVRSYPNDALNAHLQDHSQDSQKLLCIEGIMSNRQNKHLVKH